MVYPSAAAANAALEKQLQEWRSCANRSVFRQVNPGDPSAEVKFADVVEGQGKIALPAQALGPSGVAGDRGLDAKTIVVVDAIGCQSDSATKQVLELVGTISAQIN